MNFTLKLTISEIVKNKSKVLIAIIVTLILFMSAFTLCNISTALPDNFYNYYEKYMHDTIGVYISNADKELYDKQEEYFVSFNAEFELACKNYSLSHSGVEQLPYEDDQNGYTNYFNNILLKSGEYPAKNFEQFIIKGEVWQEPYVEDGIWLSDFAAKNLSDNSENNPIDVGEIVEYNFNDTIIELNVIGIFDSERLQNYLKRETGSNQINKYLCFITETTAKRIVFESNTTFNAYGIVGKIDKLYDVYNTLYNKYSLSEGTAFSLIKQVKNTQIICLIVGVIMIICGIIILLNFINMIISQNIKHISLLRILGTDTFKIMLSYFLIFLLLITIICVISWMTLPLYNYIVSIYCANIGYPFAIGINYWVVLGVFAVCYFIVICLMVAKWLIMDKTPPAKNILEED